MLRILLAAFVTLVVAVPAWAHPHVWVTMRTELGSHLLAAEDCEDASVRPEVIVSVLRRAVERLSDDDVDLEALTA